MVNLQTFFADTVARGWAPVNPCTDERELAQLEQSLTRGDCISPLVQEGDVVYIDRTMRPEPGDVVSFSLSQRGADAQNTPPMPPGQVQGQWKKGDRWCKLYGLSHGYQMLYDRHGSEFTATLATCESPDDTPILHPVRQIRRNGKLLFDGNGERQLSRRSLLLGGMAAPLALSACNIDGVNVPELPAANETSGAQVGPNAATQPYAVTVAGPNSYNAGTVPTAPLYYASIAGVGIDPHSLLRATLTFDASQSVGGASATAFMDVDWGSGSQASDLPSVVLSTTGRYAVQMSFTGLPANTAWTLTVRINCSSSAVITIANTSVLAEVLKR